MFLTAVVMVLIDTFFIAPSFGQSSMALNSSSPASLVTNLLLFFPSLTVTVRRLHDIDKSGLWLFIVFVPLIGALLLFIWSLQGGTRGSNSYGPAPY